jgi:transposase
MPSERGNGILPLLTRVDRHYVPTCVWCSDGRLISRTGRSRFPTASAFANYAGAAPVEIASAEKSRHRLSRHGDRQLNSALHTIAITQIRMSGSRGNLYYRTKIAEGKTPREAARCLKRRLADHIWHVMITDERRQAASLRGHLGAALQSSAAGSTPTTSSSDKSLPRPAAHDSTTTKPAAWQTQRHRRVSSA